MLEGMSHLSFEAGTRCNLSAVHKECPSIRRDRFPTTEHGEITDIDIVQAIGDAVTLGFNGLVGFHYYNEPLLYPSLIRNVISMSAYNRFVLWTNGELLDRQEDGDNSILELFELVVITNYNNDPWYETLREKFPQVAFRISGPQMDTRIQNYDAGIRPFNSCSRPHFEIPIDHYGNVHLCCQDWKGEVVLGNILEKSFYNILTDSQYQDIVGNIVFGGDSVPEFCRRCLNRM